MNMNKQVKLAVAGALLALGATVANAGISIPAGDWTVDISGNVNAFYINNHSTDTNDIRGGLANTASPNGNSNASSINTGLLPSWLTIGAKTRQNDLDVAWAISFQPGASSQNSLLGGGRSEYRQAYITFGDKSWGSIKIGKDLGQFGANAILNDMTLLGVGSQGLEGLVGAAGGSTTTLGRIGTGFLYADFNGQINYTSPDWNGFQFVVGIDQPLNTFSLAGITAVGTGASAVTAPISLSSRISSDPAHPPQVSPQGAPAYVGVASYSWAGDMGGKVWAEVKQQSVDYTATTSASAVAGGIGARVDFSGVGLTAYYYGARGVGTTAWLMDGVAANGQRRTSNGYYVQGTYAIPNVGTKLGISYGRSTLDLASGETANPCTVAAGGTPGAGCLVQENNMFTVGAYHPLTKHLNLVAEYSRVNAYNQMGQQNSSDIVDVGAILFF